MADEFTKWKHFGTGTNIRVDPGVDGFDLKMHGRDFTEEAHADRDGCYEIRHGEFVLCKTKEFVRLSLKVAARIEGRSTLGRVGLGVHVTAPTIHAGFAGTITLEVFNHSRIPVILRPGMKIGQLIFERVDGVATVRDDRTFQNQNTAIGVNVFKPAS